MTDDREAFIPLSEGTRQCPACREWLPHGDFYQTSSALGTKECKLCRRRRSQVTNTALRALRDAHPEEYRRNLERAKRRFGLSPSEAPS